MRRQLPVHSPVGFLALAAGVAAAVRGDRDGRLHRRVVDALGSRFDALDVMLTDSGTSALRLAIAGAVRGRENPVALPGYTCYDMATAAEGAEARVALYDLDPATLGPDLASLRGLGSVGLSAVVVGHLFGHLVDVSTVQSLVGDALVIEDAAQGVGGRLHGRRLGSFGSLSVLSFGRGKGMTGGGGGAVLAHDDRGREALRWVRERAPLERGGRGAVRMAALGAQWMLGRPALYGIPTALPFLHLGETRYHPPWPPTEPEVACLAALGRVIADIDREVSIWRQNAIRLERALSGSRHLRGFDPVPGGEPGSLRLPALVSRADRGRLLDAGAGRLGIMKGYPRTLAELPSLGPSIVGPPVRLPGSAALARALITLPTHGLLTESDLSGLEAWIATEG